MSKQTGASMVGPEPVTRRMLLAAVILSAVIGVVVGSLMSWAVYHHESSSVSTGTQPIAAGGDATSVSAVAAAHGAALVSIATQPLSATSIANGTAAPVSGFIVSSDGYVVTSAHAVTGATALRVATEDGTVYPATLVATDTTHGIAILHMTGAHGLATLAISTRQVSDGDLTLLISRSDAGVSVGVGTIRSQGAAAAVSATTTVAGATTADLPVTAADDGGALLDGDGGVIGVAVVTANSPIAVAAPVAALSNLVSATISSSANPSRTGIATVDLDAATAHLAGLPAGALVVAVDPAGAGHGAGIAVGDVIVAVNGSAIDAADGFESLVANVSAGSQLTLTVVRGGDHHTVTLTSSAT